MIKMVLIVMMKDVFVLRPMCFFPKQTSAKTFFGFSVIELKVHFLPKHATMFRY